MHDDVKELIAMNTKKLKKFIQELVSSIDLCYGNIENFFVLRQHHNFY